MIEIGHKMLLHTSAHLHRFEDLEFKSAGHRTSQGNIHVIICIGHYSESGRNVPPMLSIFKTESYLHWIFYPLPDEIIEHSLFIVVSKGKNSYCNHSSALPNGSNTRIEWKRITK